MRSTSDRSFFDTNVLVYTDDLDSPEKGTFALELLRQHGEAGTGALSTQVLQEYFAVTTRKLGTAEHVARDKAELFARLDVVSIGVEHILSAIDLHRLHQLSFWDALIVEAALRARCSVIYTEDLQHGFRISGVEIVNPFV